MSKICLRHELAMLGLGVAGLRGGDRGFRSADHARVLRDIEACGGCRARRAPASPPPHATHAPTSKAAPAPAEGVGATVFKAVREDDFDEPGAAKLPTQGRARRDLVAPETRGGAARR